MKSFMEDYSRIIGFILLTFVVILLLATPSMIFAHAITMIIGGWIGSDYDTAGVAERLGADVMLMHMRDYIY